MRLIIFVSITLFPAIIYSMEPDEIKPQDFEHRATFETYKLLSGFPLHLRNDLLNKTAAIVGKEEDFTFYDPEARLFCVLESDVEFAPGELKDRSPWKFEVKQRRIRKPQHSVIYLAQDDMQPLKVKSRQMTVAGPNNNNLCVVDNCVIQLEVVNNQEISQVARLMDHLKNIKKYEHKLPGHLLVIHPYQNLCLIDRLQTHKKETIKELCLYNLDTRRLDVVLNYSELAGGLCGRTTSIGFGCNNTILLVHNGILFIYSLDKKYVEGIIYDNQYVPRNKFDGLIELYYDTAAIGEFERFGFLGIFKQNRSFLIENFHYSFDDHPEWILFSSSLYFSSEEGNEEKAGYGLFNTVDKRIFSGLTERAPEPPFSAPCWQNSIRSYGQYDPRNLLPNHRDVVSMISWDMNDLNMCLLIRIAHNWLQNKEKNLGEARSILSALYHSENKWKLLLKSTYVDDLGRRKNPFKIIFKAIKQLEHTHLSEII